MSDEFLRLLLCRHVFASVVLRVHRSFRSRPKNHPTAHPPLPDLDVVDNPTLQRYTLDLAMQGHSALERCLDYISVITQNCSPPH